MKNKTTKRILFGLGILAVIGGAVHVLQPLGFDILDKIVRPIFAGITPWIQFIAGVSTIVISWLSLKK